MTGDSRVTIHKGAAALMGIALVLIGAGAAYLLMPTADHDIAPAASAPALAQDKPAGADAAAAPAPPEGPAALPDVEVNLTPEAVERAGIVVAPVATRESAAATRLPGIVEPNAYQQVVVTPLLAGRVTRVRVELGARVRRGQTLAEIYSPELADAQTKYVAAKAMLGAHDLELQRTHKLVEIGAASRQELERAHAEHETQSAMLQSARAQLELLGVPPATIDAIGTGTNVSATATVPAPIDGVITARTANVGLNVDPATELFTVVDLSTVWVVADVYETDFSRVQVGSPARVTTAAYPDVAFTGSISYIDPQVNPDTRTAKVRVEVPNPRGELRLGMYADVLVTGAAASAAVVPRSAVQNVGDRTVVYVVSPQEPATFIEREVRVSETSGDQVVVQSGVQPGDLIVTEGSFFVRAERERLGLRPPARSPADAEHQQHKPLH
jgi:RND family efflux transporter MFP subunit